MTDYTPAVTGTGARAVVQRFGAFLAGMVMPNLGAFIAFGLITSLFIPDGWVNKIAGTQTEVIRQALSSYKRDLEIEEAILSNKAIEEEMKLIRSGKVGTISLEEAKARFSKKR